MSMYYYKVSDKQLDILIITMETWRSHKHHHCFQMSVPCRVFSVE